MTWKKLGYGILAGVIVLLWGVTMFVQPHDNQVAVSGVVHHTQTLRMKHEKDPAWVANIKLGGDAREACAIVSGFAAFFMFLCPLAAWEFTIQPPTRAELAAARVRSR